MRGSRAVGLLTALVAFSAPLGSARAADLTLTVSDVHITSGPNPTLVLSGLVRNNGQRTVTDTMTLVTSGPMSTRTALDSLLRTNAATGIRALPFNYRVTDLAPGDTRPWTLTAAMSAWDSGWSGVIGVGARMSTQTALTAVPWFPPANQPRDPTRLTFVIRLALADPLLPSRDTDLPKAQTELDRLERLVDARLGPLLVDQQVVVWLASLAGSPLSARAAALAAQLNGTIPSVYADAQLDRLAASKRLDLVTGITGDAQPWYLPSQVSTDTITRLANRVITVVGNDAVSGSPLITTPVAATVAGHRVLVTDRGINACFDASLVVGSCLAATIAMVTAESPNVARHILAMTPRTWDPDATQTRAIADILGRRDYLEPVPIAPGEAPVLVSLTAAPTVRPIGARTLGNVDELLDLATQVSSLFPTSPQAEALRARAIQAISPGVTRDQVAELARAGLAAGHQVTDAVAIETTGHFTVPQTSTELPFTVVNNAADPVTVGLDLVPDNPGRLRATQALPVVVESGQRVLVPVSVTFTGVGTVTGTVHLVTQDGIHVGAPARVSITSTASQRFANNLVWAALVALLLLAANNWRRRRREAT